jgi:NRPS condensation-like uncharacterized protein
MATASANPGRLNAFQTVMYQWSGLHPYNAVHIYSLAGPLQLDRLRAAVRDTYRDNGIGKVEVDPERGTFQHEVDDAPEIELFEGREDCQSQLAAHVTRELNRPFARPRCSPVRFGVIEGAGTHQLLVTYDHWLADSVAARLILRQVLLRYFAVGTPADLDPLDLYPGTYREVFARRFGRGRVALAALRCARDLLRDRSARQVAYSSVGQMAVQFDFYRTAPGTVDRLREFARQQAATVHDVFLAALGRAMARVLPRRATRGRGGDVALGTIVDTRGDAECDLSNSLGAFLSYYLVRCRPDESADLAGLTRQIAAITRPVKARRRCLDWLVNMKVLSGIVPHLSDAVRPHFFRKTLPLTAGVSNVFLREGWMDPIADERILDYARASSTGPSLPLVINPTTLGQQMNIGLSYRVTGFSRAKIEALMASLLDDLENPALGHGRAGLLRQRPAAAALVASAPLPARAKHRAA